jgi:hypothetical protein
MLFYLISTELLSSIIFHPQLLLLLLIHPPPSFILPILTSFLYLSCPLLSLYSLVLSSPHSIHSQICLSSSPLFSVHSSQISSLLTSPPLPSLSPLLSLPVLLTSPLTLLTSPLSAPLPPPLSPHSPLLSTHHLSSPLLPSGFGKVISSIYAAVAHKELSVKLNCVLMRGTNEGEIGTTYLSHTDTHPFCAISFSLTYSSLV